MASFMTKKKKYKFEVDVRLEELIEVPFISAVLFAKLRLLDGGNFQDYSCRQEVKDHKVQWNARFTFPCKMMANASTGVLERCILRISVRKESKGGRSYNKLGFVDLNLAEYAGAGLTYKKALLEGYDARSRQDNSMLKYSIVMNMLSGDWLFKVPSPSLRAKAAPVDEPPPEQRTEEYSGGSLAGSIASCSSGFGSLPKKRPPLLSSELVIGQTLSEIKVPVTIAPDFETTAETEISVTNVDPQDSIADINELGHSRNSSNTSQLSKASGYSSSGPQPGSHSRQSSSGESTAGHTRNQQLVPNMRTSISAAPKISRLYSCPNPSSNLINANRPLPLYIKKHSVIDEIPDSSDSLTPKRLSPSGSVYSTPQEEILKSPLKERLNSSNLSDEYKTPNGKSLSPPDKHTLQKSSSSSIIDYRRLFLNSNKFSENSPNNLNRNIGANSVVTRSKSDFELSPIASKSSWLASRIPESLVSFLTPSPKRKIINQHVTPRPASLKLSSPSKEVPSDILAGRAVSWGYTKSKPGTTASDGCLSKRNPSSSSLQLSETGSLDRATKHLGEKRNASKSTMAQQLYDSENVAPVGQRVETTRVDADHLIEDLLKNTNLEAVDDEAETSGLQLFIAKDGTAALGNHEVKSQMSTGVQIFKQVVMDDNR